MTEKLESETTSANMEGKASSSPQNSHSLRFWGIFTALCLLSLISALDVAIISTSLPRITADIGGAKQYVWIAGSFVMSSSVLQPLVGQSADILGRRIPLITATALFALGSGIAGGAHNVAMLIAGRTIQGIGAGAIYMLLDIVCCDMVSLRERGKYVGLMNAWAGLGAAIGPVLGGAIADSNWRWIFYMNLPICGLALGGILLFMRMKTGAADVQRQWKSKVARTDWLGFFIFTPSMIAILFGLIMGGVQHPWSSWRIIVPLVLGFVGWIVFHIQQHFASNPSIPTRLFSNRTSSAAYLLSFLTSILVMAQCYFLPVYFLAAYHASVLRAGVYFLPFAIGTLSFAIIAGVSLSKFGAYRPIHAASFAFSAIGFGLLTLLDGHMPKVGWVFIELIASAGVGPPNAVMLPAILAALPEADTASATAAYAFLRSFGFLWGVTLPSIIFNAVFNNNLHLISSSTLQSQLRDGGAYSFASRLHVLRDTMPSEVFGELVQVYSKSLRVIWWMGLGISIAGFFIVGLERGLELRTTLETEYGMDNGVKANKNQNVETGVDIEPKGAEETARARRRENSTSPGLG